MRPFMKWRNEMQNEEIEEWSKHSLIIKKRTMKSNEEVDQSSWNKNENEQKLS